MEDYLIKYMTSEGLDSARLLNDDFIEAIRVLFQAGLYVSATKLLMSFIDSLGYLEDDSGSGGEAFKGWLDRNVELAVLGISAEELWEHRNSILHMTNLNSRKVSAGKTRRLVAYIGILPPNSPTEDAEAKWFDLSGLIKAVILGCDKMLARLNANPDSFASFFKRYDEIVSDVRYQKIEIRRDG